MFVSDEATLDVSFNVALARLAALIGNGVLTRVSAGAYAAGAPAGPRAALLQLAGVYRVRSGEAGHRVATVTIGGFLSRIAETIVATG